MRLDLGFTDFDWWWRGVLGLTQEDEEEEEEQDEAGDLFIYFFLFSSPSPKTAASSMWAQRERRSPMQDLWGRDGYVRSLSFFLL